MKEEYIERFINTAIAEDIGEGDHTTLACIAKDTPGKASLVAKQDGIISGVSIAKKIYQHFDSKIALEELISDGSHINFGDEILQIEGSKRSLLQVERLVLNVMQRMSGIATQTNYYVKLIAGTGANILDTRKTTPGFRLLEKEAVRTGGGMNHRMGLYDMILIKDNHIDYTGSITKAVRNVQDYLKRLNKALPIIVEVRDMDELDEALSLGTVDRVMLDNFSLGNTKRAVEIVDGRVDIESSGGIDDNTIRKYAECGVDYISIGALTHQIKSLDLSITAK